jgi:hypothetical protein
LVALLTPKIFSQKLEYRAQSKVGSMEKLAHTPGGGKKSLFTEKETSKSFMSRQISQMYLLKSAQWIISYIIQRAAKRRFLIRNWTLKARHHRKSVPPKISTTSQLVEMSRFIMLNWISSRKLLQKLDQLKNCHILHKEVDVNIMIGNVKIYSAKLNFKEKAASKVGSIDNIHHTPKVMGI